MIEFQNVQTPNSPMQFLWAIAPPHHHERFIYKETMTARKAPNTATTDPERIVPALAGWTDWLGAVVEEDAVPVGLMLPVTTDVPLLPTD
jgi:hypothetical protein